MAESPSSAAASAATAAATAAAAAASSAEAIAAAARVKAADGGSPGFERLSIPFIIDKVDVTDPDLIRMITKHPDVDRLHGSKDKPW